MNKKIVITTINEPTPAVRRFAELKEYDLIVVGDHKTPKHWNLLNTLYLSPEAQGGFYPTFSKLIPFNHYSRKMIGYAYAIRSGAEVIIDTDDDNIPYQSWGFPAFSGRHITLSGEPTWANVYKFFTDQHIWPRGFPLNQINNPHELISELTVHNDIGIWQSLADGDPDVDAIYRLTIGHHAGFGFQIGTPVVLDPGIVCPFNSQNTAFRKELFPLLYLPATVSFRFTDILRGVIAQPLMWRAGYKLGFNNATVMQVRNPHNYMDDFKDELSMYLNTEVAYEIACKSSFPGNSIKDNLYNVYLGLVNQGICGETEINILTEWLKFF